MKYLERFKKLIKITLLLVILTCTHLPVFATEVTSVISNYPDNLEQAITNAMIQLYKHSSKSLKKEFRQNTPLNFKFSLRNIEENEPTKKTLQ